MDRSTRPPYPALSPSTSSSVYSSSSSLSSMPSPAQAPQDALFNQQSAPLPSPTTEQRQYFGSLDSPSVQQQQHQQQHQQQQQQQHQQTRYFTRSSNQTQPQALSSSSSPRQAAGQPPQPASASQQMQPGFTYMPDRQRAGTTNAQTMAMLADYNLVAEAAKRAQVACIIRDLDEMDMS